VLVSGKSFPRSPSPLYLHDTATGRLLVRLWGHPQDLTRLSWSADGLLLVSCGPSGGLRLWEAATGQEVCRLDAPDLQLQAIALAPDGRFLARAWADGTIRILDTASGREGRRLPGHATMVTCLAFTRDGRRLASGDAWGNVLIWDLSDLPRALPGAGPMNAAELDRAWQALAGRDGRAAWQAVWRLAAAPDQAVPFLRQRVAPVRPERAIQQLIRDLDGDRFDTRERASRELEELGQRAGPALRRAVAGTPSPELRRRATELLDKLDRPLPGPGEMPAVRALAALERMGTPGARRLLRELADGLPEARLTEMAKGALERLSGRTVTGP
jgi:hypothetical protein